MWCPGEQCWAADSDSSPCVLCPLDSGNSESGLGLVSYLVSFVQGGMMRSSTITVLRSSFGSVRNQFGGGSPGEASILVKVSQQDKAWLWSLLEKQKSRRTGTGTALQVCPNAGGAVPFLPWLGSDRQVFHCCLVLKEFAQRKWRKGGGVIHWRSGRAEGTSV